jgi:hypothetical protein
LAHECNLTQPSRRAAGRTLQDETRPIRGAETAESTGTSGPMDFTVSLDRQTSRRPNQTYVVGSGEGSSQDDVEPDRELPGRNQENEELNVAGQRESGTRSRGLTVRISEQPESGRPIQPEGASTPLDEGRTSMARLRSILLSRGSSKHTKPITIRLLRRGSSRKCSGRTAYPTR